MKTEKLRISQSGLIIVASLFLMIFANVMFFKGVLAIYPLGYPPLPDPCTDVYMDG